MKWLAFLFLGFALISGMAHAPAVAHTGMEHAHSDHGTVDILSLVEDNGDQSGLPDVQGDNVHSHQCPAAIDARSTSLGLNLIAGKLLLPFPRAAILTSFSQAPPTEPPSA